jgi:hypothetical protein
MLLTLRQSAKPSPKREPLEEAKAQADCAARGRDNCRPDSGSRLRVELEPTFLVAGSRLAFERPSQVAAVVKWGQRIERLAFDGFFRR